MLSIDGTAMPAPSALKVTLEDAGAAAERSAAGTLVRDFAGARRRLKLRWATLTGDQLRALLRAVDARFFNVTYPDPEAGGTATIHCCCAKRSMGVLRMRDGAPVWTDIEMEWMEG